MSLRAIGFRGDIELSIDEYDLLRLRNLLDAVRRSMFGSRKRVQVRGSERREVVAEKLVDALNVVEGLAKKSGRKARKGSGGVPAKARWYQLMTYIAQILDRVLRSVELGEVETKLKQLETTVDGLQRGTPQPAG